MAADGSWSPLPIACRAFAPFLSVPSDVRTTFWQPSGERTGGGGLHVRHIRPAGSQKTFPDGWTSDSSPDRAMIARDRRRSRPSGA
ncbi:hypothetical protein BD309DRAFT_864274 [Dichomitus squalens]|uniref:Uncharacterized protein n=1 Tax=Dichomitus squalens TaxID=114155 RepID=A0A4Q9Q3J2_9APHY|nr:uncharacterized protein DICSQDRAFT_134394 [Dichomitus squalens LYAD-421 SS1]EJF63796.1 hypothetical protein DICSQDRAFT_134394 [Dichomitus squalens LYAD-421 SS1]TBU43441.1 hypothetical protein BD309DRAFT_864274 [Dichomitus squalens]TBU61164.1 hypothetical protein BD310DRAFT_846490 [Dichomitus squalens]